MFVVCQTGLVLFFGHLHLRRGEAVDDWRDFAAFFSWRMECGQSGWARGGQVKSYSERGSLRQGACANHPAKMS